MRSIAYDDLHEKNFSPNCSRARPRDPADQRPTDKPTTSAIGAAERWAPTTITGRAREPEISDIISSGAHPIVRPSVCAAGSRTVARARACSPAGGYRARAACVRGPNSIRRAGGNCPPEPPGAPPDWPRGRPGRWGRRRPLIGRRTDGRAKSQIQLASGAPSAASLARQWRQWRRRRRKKRPPRRRGRARRPAQISRAHCGRPICMPTAQIWRRSRAPKRAAKRARAPPEGGRPRRL